MLTRPILDTFATLDTERQVSILRGAQVLDTETGDAALAHLAGNFPERYSALMAALDRGEV